MRIATVLAFAAIFALSTAALAVEKPAYDYGVVTPTQGLVGGDTIAQATVIGVLPFSDSGDTSQFVNDYDEVCPYTGSTSPDVVYQYTPSGDGLVDIDLCVGSAYDTKLYVYEDTHTPGAPFACNDDLCPGWVSQLMGLQLTIGHTYFIVVDGYGGAMGSYTFDMAGDAGATPVEPATWGTIKNAYK